MSMSEIIKGMKKLAERQERQEKELLEMARKMEEAGGEKHESGDKVPRQ